LEQTPSSARAHPLFQLRQAMAYGEDGDYERALPLYFKLCQTWPEDAAGFANACDCLMKLGRWTEAETVFGRAPECYQQFWLYRTQRQRLCQRTLGSSPGKVTPFQGGRGLGGLLIPQPAKYEEATE